MAQTSNFTEGEKVAKQILNLFFIIDNSGSMSGERMGAVNNAMRDIASLMPEIQDDTADTDIKISVLVFSDYAKWINEDPQSVEAFKWHDINTEGGTNLSDAYHHLEIALSKQSKGGMMPDFGGVAPILFLLTDGIPTNSDWADHLEKLKKRPWFQYALKYALAINIDREDALSVLQQFTGSSETILRVHNAEALRKVIRLVAVTASQVKSQSSSNANSPETNSNQKVQLEIEEKLKDIKDVETGW